MESSSQSFNALSASLQQLPRKIAHAVSADEAATPLMSRSLQTPAAAAPRDTESGASPGAVQRSIANLAAVAEQKAPPQPRVNTEHTPQGHDLAAQAAPSPLTGDEADRLAQADKAVNGLMDACWQVGGQSRDGKPDDTAAAKKARAAIQTLAALGFVAADGAPSLHALNLFGEMITPQRISVGALQNAFEGLVRAHIKPGFLREHSAFLDPVWKLVSAEFVKRGCKIHDNLPSNYLAHLLPEAIIATPPRLQSQ